MRKLFSASLVALFLGTSATVTATVAKTTPIERELPIPVSDLRLFPQKATQGREIILASSEISSSACKVISRKIFWDVARETGLSFSRFFPVRAQEKKKEVILSNGGALLRILCIPISAEKSKLVVKYIRKQQNVF